MALAIFGLDWSPLRNEVFNIIKIIVKYSVLYKVAMHLKLIVQIKELVEECDTPLVQNTADEYNRIKAELSQNSSQSSPDSLSGDTTPGAKVNEDTGKNLKWSGTDFVKSPSAEPWVIYLNSSTGNLFLCLMHVHCTWESLKKNPYCFIC